MRRKTETAIGILLVFTLLELAISTSIQAAQISTGNNEKYVFIVDQNGNGDYISIQDAINNAQDGFTIYVRSGKYSEIIEVKKQVHLIGENKVNTFINPISAKNKYAVRLGAPGVIFEGFDVTNGAPGLYTSGIRITSAGIEVNNCNIHDVPVGIVIWTSDNTINNSNLWSCKDEGIALIGSSYSECSNNKITDCIFYDNCDGIELQYSSKNTISNCEIYDNTHTGIDAIASSNDNNKIEDCKIYDNEVHVIYFSSSSNNQIIDCQLSGNDDGDIKNNKNSNNNQVLSKNIDIYSSYENSFSIKEIINNLIERIRSQHFSRIGSLFDSNNF